MRHLSAAIKVGILFLALVMGSYIVWKMVGSRPSGESEFRVWALFKDASGLPVGSRVVVAGLPVGEVDALKIVGRRARVTMRIRDDVVLYKNSIVLKKSSSLLGDFYLEIDPGTDVLPSGTKNELLENGQQILRTVEATSPDQLIKRLEESIPKVDAVLESVQLLSEDVRRIINGPVSSMAARLDSLIAEEAGTVAEILQRTNSAVGRVDAIGQDIQRQTREGGRIDDLVDRIDSILVSTQHEVEQAGEKVQELLAGSTSVINKIDNDKGTLGRLVNDSTLIDNLEDISESAKGFLGTIFGIQTYVGLRGEYSINSGASRFYVTLELRTRPDKFYYVELMQGARGVANVDLVYDPELGRFRQAVSIEDKIRFTFQFARRVDWLTLRYGIKENTGGVGADGDFFDNKLRLSLDVFEATFDKVPRVKLTAAFQFFGFLYVMAGVDDLLNNPDELLVETLPGSVTANGSNVPQRFRTYPFGRDVFFGAMVQFNDQDLAALLTVGGSVLSGAVQ